MSSPSRKPTAAPVSAPTNPAASGPATINPKPGSATLVPIALIPAINPQMMPQRSALAAARISIESNFDITFPLHKRLSVCVSHGKLSFRFFIDKRIGNYALDKPKRVELGKLTERALFTSRAS